MTRTPRIAIRAMVAIGALVATAALATPAEAGPSRTGGAVAVHDAAPSTSAQHRATSYWTTERMRQAIPLDLLDASKSVRPADVPRGTQRTIAATPRDAGTLAFPNTGGPWTDGGKVVTTAGRVFFNFDGRTASCSGNAVTSTNGSAVMTAGHCVKYQGSWHTDWVFVPGYHDGQAPYGKWAATQTMATPQWASNEDINYDVGAAVVGQLDGQRLTDVVGGQGLAFNTGYNLPMYAFGFPAADPYDGEKFIYCSGDSTKDPLFSNDHGLDCDMTGGSSGGPWFTQFDEATGTGLQASVNSFGYQFLPGVMFGPYFGTDAQNLYDQAQSS